MAEHFTLMNFFDMKTTPSHALRMTSVDSSKHHCINDSQNGTDCFCSDSLSGMTGILEKDCNIHCNSACNDRCGGLMALSVFKTSTDTHCTCSPHVQSYTLSYIPFCVRTCVWMGWGVRACMCSRPKVENSIRVSSLVTNIQKAVWTVVCSETWQEKTRTNKGKLVNSVF